MPFALVCRVTDIQAKSCSSRNSLAKFMVLSVGIGRTIRAGVCGSRKVQSEGPGSVRADGSANQKLCDAQGELSARAGPYEPSIPACHPPTVCARRQESRERVLLHDGAKVIIGGVRFKNLDPNFPFVELNANFDLLESTVIEDAAAVARQQFGRFAPKGILIVGAPDVAVSSAIERWSHTVGGRSTPFCRASLPIGLTCSFPAEIDFYEEYRAAYAAWQATSPRLSGYVGPEPRSDLEASAERGLVVSLADATGWCGVAAAREQALYGTRALYIFEIFLVERWRGKGAAKAVDAALVASAATSYPVVWEHIHSENWPSLRVAFAQGRSLVETEYFVPYQ
jgi:hypothetical protein